MPTPQKTAASVEDELVTLLPFIKRAFLASSAEMDKEDEKQAVEDIEAQLNNL